MRIESATAWARHEFGACELGDVRRTRRLVGMAAGVARRPSGKVSVVYARDKDREGAYDFLESPHFTVDQMTESMCAATVARAAREPTAYVVVDATHLTIADDQAAKGLYPFGETRLRRAACEAAANA